MSKQQVAVVTGGGHGIGRALCRRLHRDDVAIVVVDIEEAAAQTVAEELGGHARVIDVANEDAVAGLVESVEDEIGPIDLFVSNAGVGYGDGKSGAVSKAGPQFRRAHTWQRDKRMVKWDSARGKGRD